MLVTPKCIRRKTSPKFAPNKTKVKSFTQRVAQNLHEMEKAEIIFLKPAQTCSIFFKKLKKLPKMTPNLP